MTVSSPAPTTISRGAALVCRADDAGSFLSANEAIAKALQAGVVRNVSVLAAAPHFDDAARRLHAFPNACLGLHIALTSEWPNARWGPVARRTSVGTLIAPDGNFHPTALHLFDHGVDLEQAMLEVRAQLQRARDAHLDIRYVDEHMGVGWVHAPGREELRLRTLLKAWAASEGLLWHDDLAADLPETVLAWQGDAQQFANALCALPPAAHAWVVHPALDTAELRGAPNDQQEGAALAHARSSDLAHVTNPALTNALRGANVRLARYDELASGGG